MKQNLSPAVIVIVIVIVLAIVGVIGWRVLGAKQQAGDEEAPVVPVPGDGTYSGAGGSASPASTAEEDAPVVPVPGD